MRLNLESREFSARRSSRNISASGRVNPEITGAASPFEPHSFSPEKLYYAPYFYQKGRRAGVCAARQSEYDYFKWDWYPLPKEAGRPLWSEPYFDDGGGNAIMTTYSVPFTREGKFWGIATIDIAMNQLIALTESIVAGKGVTLFIVSKQGRLLAYPEKERDPPGHDRSAESELARHMLAGEDGFLRTADPLRGEAAWITYVPIGEGGLSLAIVHRRRNSWRRRSICRRSCSRWASSVWRRFLSR
jgi:sigma-B regulation protein RsbU (phosphoserine phosphatase)